MCLTVHICFSVNAIWVISIPLVEIVPSPSGERTCPADVPTGLPEIKVGLWFGGGGVGIKKKSHNDRISR